MVKTKSTDLNTYILNQAHFLLSTFYRLTYGSSPCHFTTNIAMLMVFVIISKIWTLFVNIIFYSNIMNFLFKGNLIIKDAWMKSNICHGQRLDDNHWQPGIQELKNMLLGTGRRQRENSSVSQNYLDSLSHF